MKALIDGDIVCYRCAAVNENADVGLARWQADELITRILEDVNATDWKVYLSGENNFRYQLYPAYKANRKDKPKPKHLEALREHLLLDWPTEITDGYEADDALGINNGIDTVLCSIDKDLWQLPGYHYHFVKREWMEVSNFDGWRNFYLQLLIGDTADNIPGCSGIGKVKAPKILGSCKTEFEMYEACVESYKKSYQSPNHSMLSHGDYLEDMHLNAQLLYVWRKTDDRWIPPLKQQKQNTAIQS